MESFEKTTGKKVGLIPVGRIERVAWDPTISVHVEEIDAQHRELFSIINRIADLYESGSLDAYPVLQDLVQYLTGHFHSENVVMSKILYPHFVEHSRSHERFIDKMQEFLKGYEAKDEKLIFNMLTYCRDWLYNHTLKADMNYAEHMVRTGMLNRL